MTGRRDEFLDAVREAVRAGNRPGVGTSAVPESDVGYQGAGAEPISRFRDELLAAGGYLHVVPDRETAATRVFDLVQSHGARRVLVGRGPVLDSLRLPERLRGQGLEVALVENAAADADREAIFAADVGVSGVDYLIAETGTVVLFAAPREPRSLSLLPPIHVAVAERSQVLPDLFDLFAVLPPEMPSCVSLITGPSKTGDIELRLVTGVHGPGELHVVLLTG